MEAVADARRQRRTGLAVRKREQHRRQRASHFVLVELT